MTTTLLNRWLPALTLGAWGIILLYFHLSGRLTAFLHPTFRPGVLIAGLALLAMAVVVLLSSVEECCEANACSHGFSRLTFGKLLAFSVLLVPLSLALFSEDGFSLTAIKNRGMVTDVSELAKRAPLSVPSPDATDGNLQVSVIDLLYAAQDDTLQTEFSQRPLEITGQLMATTEMNPRGNRMRLVRMFMSCCAADAKPVGALIELRQPVAMEEMAWVKVTGTAYFPMEGGKKVSVLKVESIEPASAPDESMLY